MWLLQLTSFLITLLWLLFSRYRATSFNTVSICAAVLDSLLQLASFLVATVGLVSGYYSSPRFGVLQLASFMVITVGLVSGYYS